MQNIGEVARSDGGVENNISSIYSYQIYPLVLRALSLYSLLEHPAILRDTAGGEVKKEKNHKEAVLNLFRDRLSLC